MKLRQGSGKDRQGIIPLCLYQIELPDTGQVARALVVSGALRSASTVWRIAPVSMLAVTHSFVVGDPAL